MLNRKENRCRNLDNACRFHDRHYQEFKKYHRYLRFCRPIVVIFYVIILYLLFKWAGIKTIGIIFAVFISIKEIFHFLFLGRLEKRIFRPIEKIRGGLEEIAQGNYHVKIDSDVNNEFGLLIDSFNEMARKLQASEQVKREYEENRKALVANISHDLKTPIAAIQGYIEAINEGVVTTPEKLNKYLEIIHNNIFYINKLVDDLFLFARLDMEKLDFQYEQIPIRSFLNDLLEEFKLELAEKQVELGYVDKIESALLVNIDRKRISQAVRNIIGNAVKYQSERDLLINVQAYQQDDFISIEIKDNGPGIPADKLPYVFDRFYRIDTERTKNLVSTGLGLAIAKELVEAHGGRIAVTSIEKEGSCFKIMLPIAK